MSIHTVTPQVLKTLSKNGQSYRESIKFNSIREFGTWAKETKDTPRESENSSQENDDRFNGGLTFDDAATMAINGGYWQEGIEDMRKQEKQLNVRTQAQRKRNTFALVGGAVSVPRALVGHPKNMRRKVKVKQPAKVLRIAVQIACSAMTKPVQMQNRGVAILATVKQLELQGYSVEIWACFRMRDKGVKVGSEKLSVTGSVECCIKQAGATLDAAALAMPLAHVGFSRRLCFAALELMDMHDITRHGYGSGTNLPDFTKDGRFDLSIEDYLHGEVAAKYNTVDGAYAEVQKRVNQQLEAIKTKAVA